MAHTTILLCKKIFQIAALFSAQVDSTPMHNTLQQNLGQIREMSFFAKMRKE